MSSGSTIPQLTLFPLYPGGPKVYGNSGGLNGNSAFYTQNNRFVPEYAVNIPPAVNRNNTGAYFRLDGYRTTARDVSQAGNFNTPLALDGQKIGNVKQTSVPATPPSIPEVYREMLKHVAITEDDYNTLIQQNEFLIPTIGIGLKVTTDGMGGVDKVSLNPSGFGTLTDLSAIDKSFGLANRTEITSGAVKKVDPGVGLGPSSVELAKRLLQQPGKINNQAPNGPGLNPLNPNAGLFNVKALDKLSALTGEKNIGGLGSINPLLQKLYQLQPVDNGLAVAGYDSQLSAEQSRQLAASTAGLNVATSSQFKDNIASLAVASKQNESYAAAVNAPRIDETMNGKVIFSPWQAAQASQAGNMAFGNGNAFDMGAAVADAAAKKGRGATYTPFQMQTGAQMGGQSFGGSGSNPFSSMQGGAASGGGLASGGQGQPRPPRKPLAMLA